MIARPSRRTILKAGAAGAGSLLLPRRSDALFFGSGGAGTNPFTINENATSNGGGVVLPGNNSTGGKVDRGAGFYPLTVGEKTLVHLVIGDSISSNSCPFYAVINTLKNDNLNFYDGKVYGYTDPYLGPSTGPGSWPGIMADQLINAGKFQRVVTIGCAMGGATSLDWSRLGGFSHRIVASLLYCRQYNYPLAGPGNSGNWQMAVSHCLGTNDQAQAYTAQQYTDNTNSCISILWNYGYKGKIFIPTMTLLANVVSPTLQAAQAAMINNALGIYSLGNFDSLTGPTNRQPDGTHPTSVGATGIASFASATIMANY